MLVTETELFLQAIFVYIFFYIYSFWKITNHADVLEFMTCSEPYDIRYDICSLKIQQNMPSYF